MERPGRSEDSIQKRQSQAKADLTQAKDFCKLQSQKSCRTCLDARREPPDCHSKGGLLITRCQACSTQDLKGGSPPPESSRMDLCADTTTRTTARDITAGPGLKDMLGKRPTSPS